MTLEVIPSGQACGARVNGVDLTQALGDSVIADIRQAWLDHHVLAFPDQKLDDEQFERVAQYFGAFGEDPFFGPIDGHEHIAAVRREADDTSPIFADIWHSDWSFLPEPPAATLLYSLDIPPVGGDTLFANQHKALSEMPEDMRDRFEGLTAIHSAVLGYSPDGLYGNEDAIGSMDIRPSEDAYKRHAHPLIRPHPETGRMGIFGNSYSYIIGFEGLSDEEALPLLAELNAWQGQDAFVYEHKWAEDMLVMWDNRSVLHRATGGYEGHRRELHRITIY